MDDERNDGGAPTPAAGEVRERRRFTGFGGPVPVSTLVDQSLRSAELQLLDAREALKEARRRVVQLEDALARWCEMREAVARREAEARRVAAN
jgi:hypothetical protein